jgi:hypothetical protein
VELNYIYLSLTIFIFRVLQIAQVIKLRWILMVRRKLRPEEVLLITWMIKDTDEGDYITSTLQSLIVEEMNDGGMGSLKVITANVDTRVFSRELASADLLDSDQMPLFISVLLDDVGNFFELDIFKADFSRLKKFPSVPQ